MSAASALQKAIFSALSANAALTAIVGGYGVSDRLVKVGSSPTIRIAAIDSRDWSTGTEDGEEHVVTLECRSGEGGHRTVQEVAGLVRAALHDAALTLDGFALVNLRHRSTRVGRDAKAKGHVAEMVFRAVTEQDD